VLASFRFPPPRVPAFSLRKVFVPVQHFITSVTRFSSSSVPARMHTTRPFAFPSFDDFFSGNSWAPHTSPPACSSPNIQLSPGGNCGHHLGDGHPLLNTPARSYVRVTVPSSFGLDRRAHISICEEQFLSPDTALSLFFPSNKSARSTETPSVQAR